MRGIIFGIAVTCYAAALIVTVSALGLPVPNPATSKTPMVDTVTEAPLPPPATSSRTAVTDDAEPTPPQPTPAPLAPLHPEEDALLELAQKYQKSGDLKKAKATYQLLLKKDPYRDVAASRLGELYFNAGDYRQAEEMYRESARVLRERKTSATDPVLH